MDPRIVAKVLSDIAQTASETLELQDVFERVAGCVRELIPFDHMGVIRVVDGDHAVLHASTFFSDEKECVGKPCAFTEFSPRVRPEPRAKPRINDAREEFDLSFKMDAAILESGTRSSMWHPFFSNDVFTGGVWIDSNRPNAFNDEHEQVLKPIAALLGSAVEHWRMWDAERRRRERLDRL